MKLKEYTDKIQTLSEQIAGCDALIGFYKTKKENLEKELKRLLDIDLMSVDEI